MDRNENEGMRLLLPLREVEPDVQAGVDIDKAKRVGRQMGRRRVVVGVAAAVSAIALVGVAVPTLSGALARNNEVTPAAETPEFGPLTKVVDVGSAGGFRPSSYRTGRDKQVISLGRADGGVGAGEITVFPPGPKPERPSLGPKSPLDGSVSFEWAKGAWAWVVLSGPEPDMQARADRVRQSVAVVSNKTPKFPFTLDRLGVGDLELASVLTFYDQQPNEPTKVTLQFTHGGQPGDSVLSIVGTTSAYGAGTTEKIGIHEATVGEKFIGITDSAKMNAIAETSPANMPAAKTLLAGLQFVPDAENTAKWVDNPLR